MSSRDDRLEGLLADAIAAHDDGGQQALDAFLAANPTDATALQRGLARCRQMGMLGGAAARRDFPERLGEFRLLRRLGSGGMGVVYEAEQASLGRRVALKVVRPELLYFEGARERFRREIEAVARLQHPAVVPVLASGDQDGVPWYAMELLAGKTVHELCEAFVGRDPAGLRGGDLRHVLGASAETGTDPLDGAWWQICTRIAHTVALGVRHAHLRGIVHRDIKPSNVMLTQDGRVVLLDFGVAMLGGGRDVTRSGQTPGSPAFMSPEQLRGDAVDERTDIYSLGATLWQMLTLKAPFRGEGDLQRIRDGNVPAVLAHNREVPRELVLVVQKAMDRDRERRYADVDAFAEDLTAVLQRRPIRARRLNVALRGWRWCQRHRVTATALAVTCAIGLCLPGLFAWRESRFNRELNASLDTALEAIRSQLVLVGDDKLRYMPGAAELAEGLLAKACTMYRELLPKYPDSDRLRADAGEAMNGLANLMDRSGRVQPARALREEVIGMFAGRDDLTAPQRIKRAIAYVELAGAEGRVGNRAAAERWLAAIEPDVAALATDEHLHRESVRLRVKAGTIRACLCEPVREAEAFERQARSTLELARSVRAETDNRPADVQLFVEIADSLATMYTKNNRGDDALPLLEEALAAARAVPADALMWPPPSQLVATVLQTFGNLYFERQDMRAVAMLKECLELREDVVRDHPNDLQLRSDLGAALHNLAELSFAQQHHDLALERVDRAIAEQRRVVAALPAYEQGHDYLRNHLRLRGSVLAQLGRAADLHATAVELGGMRDDTSALRSAARLWLRLASLAGEARDGAKDLPTPAACDDAAMQLLLRAEEIGWGRGSAFGDVVYGRLRGRADFQALQQRVAARVKDDQAGGASPSTSNASREMPR